MLLLNMKIIIKDVLAGLVVLALLVALNIDITLRALDWLVAHGLGSHVPESGPLREEFEETAAGVSAIIVMFVGLFTAAPVIFVLSWRKLWIWNPSRPWNKKKADDEREAVAPEWTKQRLAYEQKRKA